MQVMIAEAHGAAVGAENAAGGGARLRICFPDQPVEWPKTGE
jgi:hypothetical protein